MDCLVAFLFALSALGADGKPLPTIRLESDREVASAEVSRDGKSLWGVVKDGRRYQLAAWDIASKSRTVLARDADVWILSLSPDGKSALGGIYKKTGEDVGDVDYSLWDIATKSQTSLLKLTNTHLLVLWYDKFSPDGTLLAIADGGTKKVHLWQRDAAGKWSLLRVLGVAQRPESPEGSRLVPVFTPNNKQLFVSFLIAREKSYTATGIEKWDVATGRRIPFPVKPVEIEYPSLGFWGAPLLTDGKTLCLDSKDGGIGIDAESGRRKYAFAGGISAASLSPNHQVAATVGWVWLPVGESPTQINVWKLGDGSQSRLEVPYSDKRPTGTFSADSRFFVCAAGSENRSVYIIDVKKTKIKSSLTLDGPVNGLFPLDSGEIAAVGIEPKAIVIWKIKVP